MKKIIALVAILCLPIIAIAASRYPNGLITSTLVTTSATTLAGTNSVTGVTTFTSGPILPVASTSAVTTAVGQIILNSNYDLYVATSLGGAYWVRLSSQTR